jgi:hypothetical protein
MPLRLPNTAPGSNSSSEFVGISYPDSQTDRAGEAAPHWRWRHAARSTPANENTAAAGNVLWEIRAKPHNRSNPSLRFFQVLRPIGRKGHHLPNRSAAARRPEMNRNLWGWVVLIFANVLAWGMLGFQGRIGAAPQDVKMPFDNAIQQRAEMIRELREIKTVLKEQNSLLRAAVNRPETHERKTKP